MKKVGIAVVGLGRIARSHIDGILQNPDLCCLQAVVDIQEDLAKQTAKEFGVKAYFALGQALADPDVDAVVVCLPHHLHEPITVQAASAGKHVLVEKVMATSLQEGRTMVEAADQNGVKLMIGQSRRYFTQLQEAKKRVGEIGRVVNLLYTFACYFSKETAPPWWRYEKSTGGLVYPMLGSHSIDYTLWMMDDRKPVTVFAQGASNNPYFEGDDDVTLIIGFDDGTHATNYLSINNRPSRHEALIIGERGSIYFTQAGDHEGLIGTATTDMYINGVITMSGESKPHAFAVEMKEFVSSILEDRKPYTAGSDILTQLSIIEGARLSAKEGRVVRLDTLPQRLAS